MYLRAEGPGDITDRFAALAELRQAGLIRHLGISAVGPRQLAQAQAVAPVVAVQNSYGLGYRPEQDEFVRLCGEQGVAFVPFFSIAGANREAGGGGTDSQVRLAWTLARGPHVLVIPGTGDPRHLAENVAAGDLRLSDEELARLDALHHA